MRRCCGKRRCHDRNQIIILYCFIKLVFINVLLQLIPGFKTEGSHITDIYRGEGARW